MAGLSVWGICPLSLCYRSYLSRAATAADDLRVYFLFTVRAEFLASPVAGITGVLAHLKSLE